MKILLSILFISIGQLTRAQEEDSVIILSIGDSVMLINLEDSVQYGFQAFVQPVYNIDSVLLVLESVDIVELHSTEEHNTFLLDVNYVDQGIRDREIRIHGEFGYGSTEHDSILKKWHEIDRYLFNSMVIYLENHPYPKKDMDQRACYVPNLIFHHAPGTNGDLETKKKYFSMFYKAYTDDLISSSMFWMYLYRFYEQLTGSEYADRDLGETAQIEDMINLLELHRK